MDTKLPNLEEITGLPNNDQRGYMFTLADYSKMLTIVFDSQEARSIPVVEKEFIVR